jgi:parallel beta-helix repeat protein
VKRNSIAIIALTILVLQPILIMGIGWPISESVPQASNPFTTAQEPGSRLDPGEYTPHVPIVIDETSDFETQGWPGSGTPADPYVISELNITYDVDEFLISIINTNASFVIQDCYLAQDSLEWAVRFANTTAAAIEYVTVDSARGGIYLDNCNNTQIMHSDIAAHSTTSGLAYAVYLGDSAYCSVENNRLESEYRVVYGIESHNLTLSENTVYGNSGYFVFWLSYCNDTSILSETLYGGYDLLVSHCHHLTFNNLFINGAGGFHVSQSTDILIEDSDITASNSEALDAEQMHHTVLHNTVFSSGSSVGMDIDGSNNLDITECTMIDVGVHGAIIDNSANLSMSDLSVSNTGGYGLNLNDVYNCTLENSDISNTGDEGVYFDACNNMTFVNNLISYTGESGVYTEFCENLTSTDNHVQYADEYGFYHYLGDNFVFHRNTVSYATDDGIRIDNADDASIMDNQVSYSEENGLSISDCDRAIIHDNSVDHSEDGIQIDSCVNASIMHNTVQDAVGTAVDLSDMETCVIDSNTIDAEANYGVSLSLMEDCNITNNAVTGSGFFWNPTHPIGYYEHVFENNTVNGRDIYFGIHLDGEDITANDWAQIFLVNCTNMNVHDGVFDQITIPVELIHSDNCAVSNIESTNNVQGIRLYRSENASLDAIEYVGIGRSYGVIAEYSHGLEMANSSIESCYGNFYYGLQIIDSNRVRIEDCNFNHNYRHLYVYDSFDGVILDNEFHNSISYGMYITPQTTEYIRIMDNLILNATYGIYIDRANNVTIQNNTVRYCTGHGIRYGGSSINVLNVTLNTLENNRDGIWISNHDVSLVSNNTIRWNYRYGIYVDTPAIPDIYYNIIALNHEANGEDENAGTFWDDGVDTGNWWDDYSPPGAYDVDGDTQDRYPMQYLPTEPIIDQPQDIYYAEGSTGNEIIWYAYDDYLKEWSVSIDGDTWDSDAWNYDNITVEVDGLEYGTHTAVLTVWDIEDNSASDTVIIHVYDGTKPTISNTPNTEAFVDGSGQTLSWKVSDLHPDTYTAYLDEEEWDSGSWSTGTLQINIDGMSEGEHTLKTVIRDIDGNQASDTVIILVIDDDASPTIDSPADMAFIEGTTNNQIVWNPTDAYPDRFEVISNDSVLVEGSWGGSRIVVTVDTLEVGTHTLTLTVYDKSGNSVSDSVEVQVIPVSTPPEPPPEIPLIMIAIAAAGIGVVVVIGALLYVRKRRAG